MPAPALSDALARSGPPLFGAALVGLGVQCLLRGAPVPALEPLPPGMAGAPMWAYVSGLALLVGGAVSAAGSRAPRAVLVLLGALFYGWVVLLHVAPLLAQPSNGSLWTRTFETVALGGAAWVLLQPPRRAQAISGPSVAHRAVLVAIGRISFAAALVVFGALHLAFLRFVALLVPAWIPGGMFWAGFTGAAHLAAGLALLTGVLARAAMWWYGVMFALWVLIVHAPRVWGAPENPDEWTSLLIALGMCGGAWLIAGRLPPGALADRRARRDAAHDGR